MNMNKSSWCNKCHKHTETKEWDCQTCGMSKPHPKEANNWKPTPNNFIVQSMNTKGEDMDGLNR